ncbi:MAG: hypothetical protein WKF84_24745 [Pyrinomonadaceae bacterium]
MATARALSSPAERQHDTLTEDTGLSFRAQMAGWRFVYLLDEDAPSRGARRRYCAFKTQRSAAGRKGVMQVGLKLYPRIWRSPELPFRVKPENVFPSHRKHQLPVDDRRQLSTVSAVVGSPAIGGFYHLALL